MTVKKRPVEAALPRKASTGNASSDALAASVLDGSALTVFNGTTWDRLRNDAGVLTGKSLMVGIQGSQGANVAYVFSPNDATPDGTTTSLATLGFELGYNGTTWDRRRVNTDITLLASAARTTTQTSADLVNYNGNALTVILDMTVVGTGSVTVSIDMKDTASGKYINLLSGVAITTNSVNRYRIGPNLVAVANSIAQDYLPRVFRISVTAGNANPATYSVGYHVHTAG